MLTRSTDLMTPIDFMQLKVTTQYPRQSLKQYRRCPHYPAPDNPKYECYFIDCIASPGPQLSPVQQHVTAGHYSDPPISHS